MEAEVQRHNSVLRRDSQLILCPRESGYIAVPEAANPIVDVFHIAVQHFPYSWQSPLAPDSGSDFRAVFWFVFYLSSFSKLKPWGLSVPQTLHWALTWREYLTPPKAVLVLWLRTASSAPPAKDAPRLLPQYSVQGTSKYQRRADMEVGWMAPLPAAEELNAEREWSCKGAPAINCAMCESFCKDRKWEPSHLLHQHGLSLPPASKFPNG